MRISLHPSTVLIAVLSLAAAPAAVLLIEPPEEAASVNAEALFTLPRRVSNEPGFEPSIRVAEDGAIYVAYARGLPLASRVFRSLDDGASWKVLPSVTPPRGAEPEIALDASGRLHFSDLWVGNVVVGRYSPQGELECFSYVGEASAAVDRQWIAVSEAGETWINTYDVERGVVQYYSPDPCLVPAVPIAPITLKPHLSSPLAYDPSSGSVFTIYAGTGAESPSGIWSARTGRPVPGAVDRALDGHLLVERNRVADHASSIMNVFPVVAVDAVGNVYAVWSSAAEGAFGIHLTWSTDGGASWAEPVRVNALDGTHVFPWIAADGAGHVAIAWLGTSDVGHPHDAKGAWRVRFAEAFDVPSGSPAFEEVAATDVMHWGPVCVQGAQCGLSAPWIVDRDLGDYIQVALDGDGKAHIAYTADYDAAKKAFTYPNVHYVRQT